MGFGIFNSPKNEQKKFEFTTMVPQVELFSFVFWENWRPKNDISKLIDLYVYQRGLYDKTLYEKM